MSRCNTSQPETHGVAHTGQAPQVAVRDGNRLLCPCCGQTLMVLKEKRFAPPKKHHAQGDPRRTWPALEKLIAQQEAYLNASAEEGPAEAAQPPDDNTNGPFYRADALVVPIDPQVAAYAFPPLDPPPLNSLKVVKRAKLPNVQLPEAKLSSQAPRSENGPYDQRRRNTRPLGEPCTYEMARLYAWAYYRLKRLAVRLEKEIAAKEAERDRLQGELDGRKQEQASRTCPDRTVVTPQTHAQAELGVEPDMVRTRGMLACDGTQRHAHEDEPVAPASVVAEQPTTATAAKERGPP